MKKPTGICQALFCDKCKGILCYADYNCEHKLTHYEDGTHVFDECNNDKLFITNIVSVDVVKIGF